MPTYMDLKDLTPRQRIVIRQANHVADQGKRMAAEQLYREAVAEFPDLPEGWLGLARVTTDSDEKGEILEHVLSIDPGNDVARAALNGASLDDLLHEPEPEPEPVEAPAQQPEEEAIIVTADGQVFEGDEVQGLRCNRCGKPIDLKNAVRTDVGYRCKDCIREIESTYYTASTANQVAGLLAATPFALLAAFLVGTLLSGFGFFSYFIVIAIAAPIGNFIGQIAFRAASKKRGRFMPIGLNIIIWLSSLVMIFVTFNWIILLIFAFVASGAAYYRVR